MQGNYSNIPTHTYIASHPIQQNVIPQDSLKSSVVLTNNVQ